MISEISKHVLEAKIKDLPFSVLKNAVKNPPTKKDFDYYIDNYTPGKATRVSIPHKDLRFFPEWHAIREDLVKIYGNIDTDYNSIMHTKDKYKGKIWASLHDDVSDVVHLNCYGRVEWLLVDPQEVGPGKSISEIGKRVILEPGDLLYMRGRTLHETIPLSERGSLIFMNLPYDGGVNAPKPEDLERQRQNFLEYVETGTLKEFK